MKTKKFFKIALYTLLIIIVIAVVVLFFYLNSTKPVVDGVFIVDPGELSGDLMIERNGWGIPSIKGKSLKDLFWGIGYAHASDRLFQMDMIRRLSTGRLSEVIGERTLDTDRYYKELLIEESIERSIHNLDPETEEALKSYCRGVNYYISHENLPPEFGILGYKPDKWEIKDCLSVMKRMETILASSGSELTNFKIASILGREKTENLISGNNPSTIIDPEELKNFYRNDFLRTAFRDEINNRYNSIGSNNWVISGSKTESGKPILANDPHLPNVFPANFYQIYAKANSVELSGNTIPGIPFIIIGRNKNISWGLTNVGTDVIDYFILKINPENHEQYLFNGKWENFTLIKKIIKIKGGKSVSHLIKMSRFGPVLEEGELTLARHSLGLYPSNSMRSIFGMNRSENISSFLTSIKEFTIPAQNVVFADNRGNIGYFPSGKIPVRSKGNGLFPVTGEGTEDMWKGFYSEDKKPYLLNPEKGFIVTANNRVLPNGEIPLYSEKWFPAFRAERITKLINSAKKMTVGDNVKIQLDKYLPGAEFLIKVIRKMKVHSDGAKYVFKHLTNWDFKADRGIEPNLFYRFEYYLARNLFLDEFRDEKDRSLISRYWIYKILNYPRGDFDKKALNEWADVKNTPVKETFEQIVERSLLRTYYEFSARGGEKKISWEKIHTILYKHPLGSIFPLNSLFNRGPYPISGGNDCIMITSFRNRSDFNTVHLSGFRMIVDMNNFSNSLMINSSGQSGHFMSRFYDDQTKLFINEKYRQMEDGGKSKMVIRFILKKD